MIEAKIGLGEIYAAVEELVEAVRDGTDMMPCSSGVPRYYSPARAERLRAALAKFGSATEPSAYSRSAYDPENGGAA